MTFQTGPGAYLTSRTIGTGYFPGVQWPGSGADQPPISSTQVENELEPQFRLPSD